MRSRSRCHVTVSRTRKWIPGLVITLLLTAAAGLQLGRGAERAAYAAGMSLAPRHPPNADVVVVGIDAAALAKFGTWPWPRSILAALTTQLAADKARVIAFVPDFTAPQNAVALNYLKELAAMHAIKRDGDAMTLLARAQTALATDEIFADSMRKAGNVVLAAYGTPIKGSAPPAVLPPWLAYRTQVITPAPTALAAIFFRPLRVQLHPPLARLGQAADGAGYLPVLPSDAPQPLLISAGGELLPAFPLLVAERDLGVENRDIIAHATGGISLGDAFLFTDSRMRAWPRRYTGGGRNEIPFYPFDEVRAGRVPVENLTGKTVIVGLTADAPASPVFAVANMVSSILNDDLVAMPFWVWWLRGLLMLLVGTYLLAVVPRLGAGIGIAASVLLLILLANGEFIPLVSYGLWLPLALPMLFLVVGHAAVLTIRYLHDRHGVSRGEFSETSRQLALAHQALGRFDTALEHYAKCQPSKPLYENLLSLGHEHERHRRYAEAIEVYTEMQRLVPAFGNLGDRVQKLQALDNPTTVTRTRRGPHITLPENGLQKPVLGRYELVRELGRGAMSVVYLGRDQKINRTVAIKTLSLRDEFQGAVPEDIARRFFREAETAGRLNHPNIVTIYDVGEDQGLAYIAMDYLGGEPLLHYTTPGKLLPMDEVMAIIIKIAEALEYAHSRLVVHRDIKPANLMYERQTGRLKITDFGVASLVNVTRTRTGTILGSPSYMSPEQVAGQKVDGRSDLYSLGVTFYQLLRGELPFEAPSLTGLMFKISNEPPPDVSFLRPDIPPRLKDIVERALQKNPDARFQTGMEMANGVRECRSKRKRTA